MSEEEMIENTEEFIEENEDEKLPFAKAEVVRLMKENLDSDKMIKERVKVEMNKFLGDILKNVFISIALFFLDDVIFFPLFPKRFSRNAKLFAKFGVGVFILIIYDDVLDVVVDRQNFVDLEIFLIAGDI